MHFQLQFFTTHFCLKFNKLRTISINSKSSGSYQRWSRRHKAQGHGHKKIQGQGQPFRRQTLSRPKTGMLEVKDTGASVLKKNDLQNFFSGVLTKKGLQNFFSGDLRKKEVFKNFFQAIYKILTIQKILLSSIEPRTGQFSRT